MTGRCPSSVREVPRVLTSEQYLGAVAERIQRSGGRLNSVQFGPAVAVVGKV